MLNEECQRCAVELAAEAAKESQMMSSQSPNEVKEQHANYQKLLQAYLILKCPHILTKLENSINRGLYQKDAEEYL